MHCREVPGVHLWFLHFTTFFSAWIFESFQILTKSLETLHKWAKQSSLMGKPFFNCLAYVSVVFQTLQDRNSIAFKRYVLCIFVHLGTHHIASNWFEILHTSPNHCLLSIKQSLSKLWCTAERFLELTCGCSILPLSFLPEFLKVWKFLQNHLKLCTNDRNSLRWWKNLLWIAYCTS